MSFRNKSKMRKTIIFLLSFGILLTATYLFARAGGAGSSSSSSSSGGGGGGGEIVIYLVIQLIRFIIITIPFPFNFITIGVIILIFIISASKGKKKVNQKSIYNNIPTDYSPGKKQAKGFKKFIAANPSFEETSFKENARSAFLQIQDAWMKKDLKNVRKFLSDGVYQRFNTQFKMMEILKQSNIMSNIEIMDVFIDRVETDGNFDIIHVGIAASMDDEFISELDSRLNMGGYNEFIEYWSFLRKRGVEKKDMFDVPRCPACDANLPDGLGEVCKCPYCGSLINSGEYDWVLSEITQADDYVSRNPKLGKSASLTDSIRNIVHENADFSVQLLEDKASNAYLQMLTAVTLKEPVIARRFLTDNIYSKMTSIIPEKNIAYNRLFLNDVSLIAASETGDRNRLFIAIKSSYQRVAVNNTNVDIIDPFVFSETHILSMSRAKSVPAAKGSVYAHQCPACGGVIGDSPDVNCQYCGTPLNSGENDWVVDGYMTLAEYDEFLKNGTEKFDYQVNPKLLDSLYDVRDFAFNNILVMAAADNEFKAEEREFAEKIAKKWGYNPDKIKGMYDLAAAGALAVKMPEKMKHREKIYKLMKKAAEVDGSVAPEEQQILDLVKERYLNN